MIQIYGIKSCTSVKKALAFFKAHEIEHTFYDYKIEPLASTKIEEWLTKTEIKTLFNAKSTTYRELKLKELSLDAKGQKEWLCRENRLIKRPVIEYGDTLMVGFNEENYTRSFL